MHAQPAASTANYGAVQAAVSDFPKNAGRCPKKCRSNHTSALPCFSSKKATGSRMLQERGNPQIYSCRMTPIGTPELVLLLVALGGMTAAATWGVIELKKPRR
jgi:hypothetical protein